MAADNVAKGRLCPYCGVAIPYGRLNHYCTGEKKLMNYVVFRLLKEHGGTLKALAND